MSRRTQLVLLAAAFVAVVLVAGSAQASDILGIYNNSEGTGESYLDIAAGSATVYLVLTDVSRPDGVSGWECHLTGDWGSNPNIFFAGETLHGQALNVSAFPDYAVGLGTSLPPDPNGNIWLASWNFIFLAQEEMYLYLGPSDRPSIPDHMVYAAGDNPGILLPMYPSSGSHDLPVFGFNGIPTLAGAIAIDPDPDEIEAPWRLEGPDGLLIEGNGDEYLEDMDEGDYSLTWLDVYGYATPPPQQGHLVLGTVLTFQATYLPSGPGYWSIGISAALGDLRDQTNNMGIKPMATDGYDDGLDLPEPPPSPSGYLTAYFPHPEWSSPLGDRFRTDYRSGYNALLLQKTWRFEVASDLGGEVLLNFTPTFGPLNGYPLLLQDLTTGESHSLFPDLQYAYQNTSGEVRSFDITVGDDVPLLTPESRDIPQGWSLIGFPLVPEGVLGMLDHVIFDDATGTTYAFSYAGHDGYVQEEGSSHVTPGVGLWIATTEGFGWSMEGKRAAGGVGVPLRNGWNLFGYPIWIPGSLAGLMVRSPTDWLNYDEAVAANLVAGFAYDYDAPSDSYVETSQLETWHGYWLAAYADSLSLWCDYRNLAGKQGGSGEPLAGTAAGDWQVNVGLAGSPDAVVFGVRGGATAGFDAAWDLPSPPASPAAASRPRLTLRHPEWDVSTGPAFRSEFRGGGDDLKVWPALLQRPQAGPMTLHWDAQTWPADLDFQVYLPAQNRVVLSSMRSAESLSLDVGAGGLAVEFRDPSMLSGVPETAGRGPNLYAVPNPFNPTTEIRFRLARSGTAELRIYNARGVLVRHLAAGLLGAGEHALTWRGQDDQGRRAASGSYFYRLYVDGRQEGPARKMTLVK